MTELEDIILTIDTREQNQVRIKAVEDWFTGHGAVVEHSALKHCDYRLIGEFREQSVNLGVEAKGWDNFLSDDIAEMEEKLLLATAEYDHVGFFVETQNYTFVPDEKNKHGKLNYSIPRLNKNLPAKTLAAFEGFLDTISKHPQIHVRQLRSEAQFPYSLYDLLVYLQKEHTVFSSTRNGTIHEKEYIAWYKHFLATIPSMTTIKRIDKVVAGYPNLFWLCSASEESLIQVLGKQVGMTVHAILHDHRFETNEWRNGYHRDGTEKDEPVCDFADPKKRAECKTPNHFKHSPDSDSIAIMAAIEGYLSGFPEGRTVNEICEHFNMKSGDPDKEKLIKYIKRLAWDEKITSDGHIFKHSSHAEGTVLIHHNPPIPSADTIPSHPDSFLESVTPTLKSDDPQRPPINRNQNSAVKQERLSYSSPAEIYKEIKPNVIDPNAKKMSLEPTIKEFLKDGKPRLMQEIVDYCKGWGAPYIFDRVMANVKSGNIKKVTEQDGRVITFQRIT